MVRGCPGRETATKWARFQTSSTSFHSRICATASAPVMKNRSASGRALRMSRRVSIVYVGPSRSMSTRLTVNRGIGRGRDDRHEVPVLALGDLALHPRLAGGDEDHLVELELLLHLARGHQVAVVDGVEGAAHDADAWRARASGHRRGPQCLRIRAWSLRAGSLVAVAVRDVPVAPRDERQREEDRGGDAGEGDRRHEQRSEVLLASSGGEAASRAASCGQSSYGAV